MDSYWIGVFTMTGITLIGVLGIAILTGFTGQFSFGHAGFMAIGAYTSALMIKYFHIPLFMGIILGVISATIIGILVGYPALKLKGDYFLIATLGFGEVVRLILENAQSLTGGAKGMTDVAGGINFPTVIIIDILVVILLINFLKSKHGRNCIAIRDDETAAQALGIDVTKYKVIAMAISCGLAGLSGALMGHYMEYLQPLMFSMNMSNQLVITVIMGGLGSITGPIIANLILQPLPEILRIGSAQELRMVIYGVIVIFIVLFKPSGIFGYKEISIKDIKRLGNSITKLLKERRKNIG
jgi:branched-chain amino acid transport system permease protein